jgi:malonyl-CoA O-methyltransferase
MTALSSLSRAACAELLDRLDHFTPEPRVVLDLGGGITADARDALRRRFPAARILVTVPLEGAARRAADDLTDAAGRVTAPDGLVRRALGALSRLVPGATRHIERLDAAPDRLPLAEGSVDLVLGHWLAPGIAALDDVLAELRRVLAPGGLFLWTTPGLGVSPQPIDLHDLGSALARAGFLEPVLDVDRYDAAGAATRESGAACEVIHAAAFAGDTRRATGLGRAGGDGETVVPIGALRRRGRQTADPGPADGSTT